MGVSPFVNRIMQKTVQQICAKFGACTGKTWATKKQLDCGGNLNYVTSRPGYDYD